MENMGEYGGEYGGERRKIQEKGKSGSRGIACPHGIFFFRIFLVLPSLPCLIVGYSSKVEFVNSKYFIFICISIHYPFLFFSKGFWNSTSHRVLAGASTTSGQPRPGSPLWVVAVREPLSVQGSECMYLGSGLYALCLTGQRSNVRCRGLKRRTIRSKALVHSFSTSRSRCKATFKRCRKARERIELS